MENATRESLYKLQHSLTLWARCFESWGGGGGGIVTLRIMFFLRGEELIGVVTNKPIV